MPSDDSDFESEGEVARPQPARPEPEPARQLQQVFYFSKKLFDFMCAGATEDYIQQIGQDKASETKAVLKKRADALVRTDKIRAFVVEKGAKKPSNSELNALKRKRITRNAATARQASSVARKRQRQQPSEGPVEGSDASQVEVEGAVQGNSVDTNSQTDPAQSKNKKLWQVLPVPPSVFAPVAVVDHQEAAIEAPSRNHSLRHACHKLCNDFTQDLDDCVAIDSGFTLPSTSYEIHGHILSKVITHCTLHKTGQAFVRWKVDHKHQFFTLLCKLSNILTGRDTNIKVSGYL